MLKQETLVYAPIPTMPANEAVYYNKAGQTYFEINNYLGTMNAVITDRKSANLTPSASNASTWEAVVMNTSDYYPFGMQMPGRQNSYGAGVEYRYAYNGMERDNEVSGNGNSYTTEFRQYDPRLGRWKSLDPAMAMFPWMSPYVAFDNNPILYVDPLGLESEGGPGDPQKHKIQKGETLTSISKKYGTSIEDIVKNNNIENPDKIFAGQELVISKSSNATVDLGKVNNKIDKLEKQGNELEIEKEKIEILISTHEANKSMVSNIRGQQSLNKKASKGNVSPLKILVDGHNLFNEAGIVGLKGKLVEETQAINKRIERYNSAAENYNKELSKMESLLEFSNKIASQSGNMVYSVSKNETNTNNAAVNYMINGNSYTYGKTALSSPKIKTVLHSVQKISTIQYNPLELGNSEYFESPTKL